MSIKISISMYGVSVMTEGDSVYFENEDDGVKAYNTVIGNLKALAQSSKDEDKHREQVKLTPEQMKHVPIDLPG